MLIFLAFISRLDVKREESEGRLMPMILNALRTTLSSPVLFREVALPHQTSMENVSEHTFNCGPEQMNCVGLTDFLNSLSCHRKSLVGFPDLDVGVP